MASLGDSLRKASRVWTATLSEALLPLGVSLAAMVALTAVMQPGPWTVAGLARHLRITSATMSATLHRMEQAGLVTRVFDEPGGARSRVALQTRRMRPTGILEAAQASAHSRCTSRLTYREQVALLRLLRRLDEGGLPSPLPPQRRPLDDARNASHRVPSDAQEVTSNV